MNAQPQAQQAPAAINQSGIAMGNMGPLTQQTQQPAPAPQGMQGLDPKLVAAMMAQYAKQKVAEENQRQMALQAPQPQGTVVDQLLAQQAPQSQPAGIQQLMSGQRGNVPQPQAQGIADAPAPQSFKEGGIVGYAEGGRAEDEQQAGDRSALINGLKKFGYAAADIAAMPPRAAASLFNSLLVRPARAVSNTDIPYFPLLGGEPGSITPFTDHAFKEQQGAKKYRPSENYGDTAIEAPTWTGSYLAPQQLAELHASRNPEEQAVAKAYDAWAAQNPQQEAAPPASAGGQGTPGGITAALPQPAPAPQRQPTQDYSALMAANARQLNTDPEKDRETEAARYRKEVGAPDTSATDAMLADYAERKQRLAPRDGIMDLLREYAKAPGQNWWQTGAAGGQSLIDLNEKLAEQRDALSDKGFAAMQARANAGRDFNKEAYGAGIKGKDTANAQLDKGVTAGTSMRNADVAAAANMYHADTQLRAAQMSSERADRALAAGDKAELAAAVKMKQTQLTSLQKDVASLLKEAGTLPTKEALYEINKLRAVIAQTESEISYYGTKVLGEKYGSPAAAPTPNKVATMDGVKRTAQPITPVIN